MLGLEHAIPKVDPMPLKLFLKLGIQQKSFVFRVC